MSGESRQVKVACVVLAAGMSVRFGGLKQIATVKSGKSLLQVALDTANNSEADYVLLVVGSHSSEILGKVQTGRAQLVLNKNFREGLSSSIKCGIANLPGDCDASIFMVADQPFLRSEHLNRMIQNFKEGKGVQIVALSHRNQPRNPVLVAKALFPSMSELKGDTGAKDLVRISSGVRLVEIDDAKTFLDVDTRSELSEI